jgi:hypothetical protein
MSEAEKIAAGLTARQQRELLTLSGQPQGKSITWRARFGYGFERLGLTKRTLLTDRTYLTPLGLEVRAVLERQS